MAEESTLANLTPDSILSGQAAPGADGSAALGDSTASPAAPVATAEPPPPQRPCTRLQSGIRQPKVYTDGTVRYSLFTSTGEPQALEEALGDKN